MAAKRVDPLKAKAAKQKKIAIGLVVLLVAVLAIQGPKMLNMLKGPQPAAVTATTAGGPESGPAGGPAGGPAVGGPAVVPGTTGGTAAAPTDLASVPDSDQAPVVDEGQLATFERFSSKDPFAQQAQPVVAPAAKKPPATDPKVPTKDPKSTTDSTNGGFTTGGGTPSSAATLATATSIAVNGVPEDVTVDVAFPVAEPTFVLVSVAEDGKSVQIGVDGGEYASGGETLKLLLGKKLTLQNTADGSRYELELFSIKGFPLPRQKG